MKASLASATSLFAVLLLGGNQANATPSTTTGSPDAICACWTMATATAPDLTLTSVAPPEDPATGYASIVATPYTPTGRTTVVPVLADGSAPGTTTSPFETISTLSRGIVFDHAQPGKLAALSSGWSNSGGTSVYVGTSQSLVLRDGSVVSANSGYGVTPADTGGSTGPVYRDDVIGAVFIPNSGSGWQEGLGGKATLSRSVAASGPVYESSIVGSGVTDTPEPGSQSLVDFGTIQLNSSHTLDLAITNLSTDSNSSTSDLTIEGYSITGDDPGSFSASLTPGTVISAGGTLLVPITVVGTGPGDLTSNLTIFTNEGTALGGAGEAFNYLLDPLVTNGFTSAAPEPASLAVIAVGLLGLASVRRRRSR